MLIVQFQVSQNFEKVSWLALFFSKKCAYCYWAYLQSMWNNGHIWYAHFAEGHMFKWAYLPNMHQKNLLCKRTNVFKLRLDRDNVFQNSHFDESGAEGLLWRIYICFWALFFVHASLNLYNPTTLLKKACKVGEIAHSILRRKKKDAFDIKSLFLKWEKTNMFLRICGNIMEEVIPWNRLSLFDWGG